MENSKLRYQTTKTYQCLTDEYFQGDSAKVKHYTGLPNFETLMAVFSFIACAVPSTSKNSLSCFQLFILLLMKLRLNVGDQDLAQSWNLSVNSFMIHEEMDNICTTYWLL